MSVLRAFFDGMEARKRDSALAGYAAQPETPLSSYAGGDTGDMDWSRFAVGGATRPDSFTNLNPDYARRVYQLVTAAEQELGPGALRITSAYRSPELQAQLWQNALAKYGDPEIADNWVARPGTSMHNKGLAVDFAGPNGGLLRDPNSREAQWIAANASRFGLDVPMSWEPWQVELAGARG